MNGVLAKPFTKDGMHRTVKQHLKHLQRHTLSSPDDMSMTVSPVKVDLPPMGMNAAMMGMPGSIMTGGSVKFENSVKFESTPSQSPATTSSWHSPGQMQQGSPAGGIDHGYSMAMNNPVMPKSATRPNFAGVPPPLSAVPLIRMSDEMSGDERSDKRQRIYGPQGGYGQ
jgi:osomolarity two-component system, response regulator SKN7